MIALTLDAIASGADIASLSRDEAVSLLLRLASAQTRLAAALAGRPAEDHQTAELLTAPELAALLHLNESWIRGQQREGKLPFVRAGKYIRFRVSEIEAALAARPATIKKKQ